MSRVIIIPTLKLGNEKNRKHDGLVDCVCERFNMKGYPMSGILKSYLVVDRNSENGLQAQIEKLSI